MTITPRYPEGKGKPAPDWLVILTALPVFLLLWACLILWLIGGSQ